MIKCPSKNNLEENMFIMANNLKLQFIIAEGSGHQGAEGTCLRHSQEQREYEHPHAIYA